VDQAGDDLEARGNANQADEEEEEEARFLLLDDIPGKPWAGNCGMNALAEHRKKGDGESWEMLLALLAS
jgi:hypothetical protein